MNETLHLLSEEKLRAVIKDTSPEFANDEVEEVIRAIKRMREEDPLAALQEEALPKGEVGGQFLTFKLAPNFEMSMYLAQATGAAIITDHPIRWKEFLYAIIARGGQAIHHLIDLADTIQKSRLSILQDPIEIRKWWLDEQPTPHSGVFEGPFRYLGKVDNKGIKQNFEQQLNARFGKAHHEYETVIRKTSLSPGETSIQCAFPNGGIYGSKLRDCC